MKLKHFIHKLILIGALLGCGTAMAQDVPAAPQHYRFHIDSTTLMLGDQTMLTVDAGAQYPSQDELSNNDIVAVSAWIDTTDGSFHAMLTSFEEGEHWYHLGIDSILFTINDVVGVDTTTVEIRDISDILRQSFTWEEIREIFNTVCIVCSIICGAWVLAAIIALIVVASIRRKHNKPIIARPKEPLLPPDMQALKDFEALRQQQLWQQGMIKDYHTQLTDILRNYMGRAFGIQSAEMTSDQTLDAFLSVPVYSRESEVLLRQVLQTADMVKFAKSEPLPFQHDQSLNNAIAFVHATTPAPEPTTPNTQL